MFQILLELNSYVNRKRMERSCMVRPLKVAILLLSACSLFHLSLLHPPPAHLTGLAP